MNPASPEKPTTVLILCSVLLTMATGVLAQSGGDPAIITVDTRQTLVKSFFGLGVQWDPYEYEPSPAAWKLTQKRLDFLKPAFVRVMLGARDRGSRSQIENRPRL